MITLISTNRKSAILSPSGLACLKGTPAINLTSGCAHGCLYCYARGYSTYPGESKVVVYNNTLDKLKRELLSKRSKPRVVYFSPSSDMFQPIPDVLELCYSLLELLFSKGIGVAFLTKGCIPDKTMRLLINHADMVKAQVGIITPDDSVRCIFEPNATSIEMRLQQMGKMVGGGIAVEARLMPILPGITDAADSLDRLFQMIANTGVERAAISTLFLRPAIAESLRRLIPDEQAVKILLDLYRGTERLAVHAGHSSVIPLPRLKREETYTRVRQMARKYSIEVSVCGCMNPDIGGTCNIGGKWLLPYIQPSLFD
ncbi:MAG TPA: radical SAM protein [Dehalococcoidia bacterium]|nr:radical SAM protein [Dehalococcoidia bacterium]